MRLKLARSRKSLSGFCRSAIASEKTAYVLSRCHNPVLKKSTPHTHPMIRIGHSNIHGDGAFAARDIAEGERIGVYEGRRYSARAATRRDWDHQVTYVFGLTDGSLIDASTGGNATRHLNHSCAPNCIAYEESGPRGRPAIVFYALRPIRAGEELFLDYCLQVDEDHDAGAFLCTCGAAVCRGTMLAA